HVGPVVDDEQRAVAVGRFLKEVRPADEIAGLGFLLAQLHDVDACGKHRIEEVCEVVRVLPRLHHQVEARVGETRTPHSSRGQDVDWSAHALGRCRSALPSHAVDASAYSRRGMRPARYARRPASTALRIASAMSTGSSARVIADATSTAAQPSSIAIAASDAVPTPASRTTGTFARSRIIRRLYGLRIPEPLPMGAPSGMTTAQPMSSSRRASTGSSLAYGSTTNPSSMSCSAAATSSIGSGSSVRSSAITSSLIQ